MRVNHMAATIFRATEVETATSSVYTSPMGVVVRGVAFQWLPFQYTSVYGILENVSESGLNVFSLDMMSKGEHD